MNIFDFHKQFPDEKSCEDYLRVKRLEEGIVCSNCHTGKHYWLQTTKQFKCANCGKKITLTSGTMMESSNVPLLTWFRVIHLISAVKKPFSALEIQKQTGSKFYEPIWYMMQKIRITMGKRDDRYKLQGHIEIDDAFFHIVDGEDERETPREKRSKRAAENANVMVMVESKPNPIQTKEHDKKRIMGFAKMIVLDNLKMPGINYEIQKHISPTSIVISDSFSAYNQIHTLVKQHNAMVVPGHEAMQKLPWVHTVIANAKRNLLGTHHSINRQYLQNYLNEFCYKLNRRTFTSDLFDRLIVAGAMDTWY
jgi:transposase-like protein